MNPELQQERGLPRGELPGAQFKVPTDSLGLGKFGQEVICKNTLLAKEVSKLQGTVADEQAAWKVVEDQLAKVKRWIVSFGKLTAKLAESDKFLEVSQVEVPPLKKEMTTAGSEKT